MIEPRLKMSTLLEYSLFKKISGAIYPGVPHFYNISYFSLLLMDNPKSAIFTSRVFVKSFF
jgi:hypothetical protein